MSEWDEDEAAVARSHIQYVQERVPCTVHILHLLEINSDKGIELLRLFSSRHDRSRAWSGSTQTHGASPVSYVEDMVRGQLGGFRHAQ